MNEGIDSGELNSEGSGGIEGGNESKHFLERLDLDLENLHPDEFSGCSRLTGSCYILHVSESAKKRMAGNIRQGVAVVFDHQSGVAMQPHPDNPFLFKPLSSISRLAEDDAAVSREISLRLAGAPIFRKISEPGAETAAAYETLTEEELARKFGKQNPGEDKIAAD
jgi:hypothetical protein